MTVIRGILLLFALLVTLPACNKKDEEEQPLPKSPVLPDLHMPALPVPVFPDAAGVLIAVIRTLPETGSSGAAYAAFGDITEGTYTDAGTVKVNEVSLTRQNDQSYLYTPPGSSPAGIDFGTQYTWDVSGNNSIPAIRHTINGNFPTEPVYNGSTTISRNSSFTLGSSHTIITADSVLFIIASPGNTLVRTTARQSSVTFEAGELAGLGSGTGYVQIAPFSYSFLTVDSKRYYFISQTMAHHEVTIE